MGIEVGDKVKIIDINLNHWNEDEDVDSYLNKIGTVERLDTDDDYGILVKFTEDYLKTIYFYENELEAVNDKELSPIEFLMSTIRTKNGYSPELVKSVADVVWKAERAEELKREIDSNREDERELYMIIGELKSKNEKYEKALSQIAQEDTWTAHPHDIAAWALGLK